MSAVRGCRHGVSLMDQSREGVIWSCTVRLTMSRILAPALESLNYYHAMLDVSVYNSFSQSKFRGPPSDELDAAWDSIANQDQYIMRIEKQDLLRINRTDAESTAFGWEGDSDGVRMIPEVFHELHCLVSYIRLLSSYMSPQIRTTNLPPRTPYANLRGLSITSWSQRSIKTIPLT